MPRGKNFNGDAPSFIGGDGISAQTKRRLMQDAGFTREDFAPTPPAVLVKPEPLGGDPTRKVTQREYDEMLKEQKAKQQKRYLQYKQRSKR